MDKIRKAVITGATSSLGTAMISECIDNNIEVLALANRGSKNLGRIPKSDKVRIVECSVDEFGSDELLETIKNVDPSGSFDVFVNFAWTSTAGDNARNMLGQQAMNVRYSLDAVDLAEKLGCKVFIGAGSQAEYGRTEEDLTEETVCRPETAYGMAKLCAGQMTRLACRQKGIKHIWPRILSGYGPNCQPQTIINYTITELINGRSPELTACEQIWDFIYTGDVAKALLLLAEKGKDGEVYVIGSGKSRTLKEYMEDIRMVISEVPGNTGLTKVPDISFGAKPYTESIVMHLSCDISKLKNDTGFVPETDFETGIRKTIDYVKGLNL